MLPMEVKVVSHKNTMEKGEKEINREKGEVNSVLLLE